MSNSMSPQTVARQASLSMNSPGKNTGVDCNSLLQRNFPTQGLNPGLLTHRQILYHLRYRVVRGGDEKTELDLVDRVPKELWMEVHDTVQEAVTKVTEKEMQKGKVAA